MTSIVPAISSDVDLTKDQVKARVIASIIALFLAIIVKPSVICSAILFYKSL